jgi:hypothetical protein
LIANAKLPFALPLACGRKVIEKVALCCADSVIGKLGPATIFRVRDGKIAAKLAYVKG